MLNNAQKLLDRMAEIVDALPDTQLELKREHATMRVGKKVFGYFLNNHHNDGVIGLVCKALPGEREALLRSDAERFYLPMHTPKGWVGLRLDVGRVSWSEVRDLLHGSYRMTASARQVSALDAMLKSARK